MKTLAALSIAGVLIFAGSASAQIVNGNEGNKTTAEAPIGTKAGGSEASKQAPGEAAAIKGAKDNNQQAKDGSVPVEAQATTVPDSPSSQQAPSSQMDKD